MMDNLFKEGENPRGKGKKTMKLSNKIQKTIYKVDKDGLQRILS